MYIDTELNKCRCTNLLPINLSMGEKSWVAHTWEVLGFSFSLVLEGDLGLTGGPHKRIPPSSEQVANIVLFLKRKSKQNLIQKRL